MSLADSEFEAFKLSRRGDLMIIAQRKEHVVDGIVTGLIVDLLALPLLVGGLALGIWMIVSSLTSGQKGHLNPALNNYLPAHVVRALDVAFIPLLGILFVVVSACVLWLFLRAQPGFFPYECQFRKDTGGTWKVRQKLWFVCSRWRALTDGWAIWCYPVYMRGDWGHCFRVKDGRTKLLLASSGAYTESKSDAYNEALKDMATLKTLFGVSGDFRKWN